MARAARLLFLTFLVEQSPTPADYWAPEPGRSVLVSALADDHQPYHWPPRHKVRYDPAYELGDEAEPYFYDHTGYADGYDHGEYQVRQVINHMVEARVEVEPPFEPMLDQPLFERSRLNFDWKR